MTVSVLGIDGDEIWLGQVGVTMGKVGGSVIDVVGHPSECCRPVQLNMAMLRTSSLPRIFKP